MLAAIAIASGAGCRDKPTAHYQCHCTFLTDTDDLSTQRVELCETSPERAQAAARGCAQSGAPAAVQSCDCQRLENPKPCTPGDCAVREHR